MAGDVRISGDFGSLDAIARRLASMRAGEVAAKAAEPAVFEQYQIGFSEKRSPYGHRWPERRTGGGWPLMIRTTALANPEVATSVSPGGGRVKVVTEGYGKVHQFKRREPRKILPYEDGSMWDRPIESAIESAIESYLENMGR